MSPIRPHPKPGELIDRPSPFSAFAESGKKMCNFTLIIVLLTVATGNGPTHANLPPVKVKTAASPAASIRG